MKRSRAAFRFVSARRYCPAEVFLHVFIERLRRLTSRLRRNADARHELSRGVFGLLGSPAAFLSWVLA